MTSKQTLLAEIEQLKRDKPLGWRKQAGKLVKQLSYVCADENFREVFVNSEMRGHEMVGRKCRSTKISAPY